MTEGDPSRPQFQVEDLAISPQVGEEGIHRRKAYLKTLDTFQREWEKRPESETGPFDRAFRLVSSPEAKQAFDLSRKRNRPALDMGPNRWGKAACWRVVWSNGVFPLSRSPRRVGTLMNRSF